MQKSVRSRRAVKLQLVYRFDEIPRKSDMLGLPNNLLTDGDGNWFVSSHEDGYRPHPMTLGNALTWFSRFMEKRCSGAGNIEILTRQAAGVLA